VLNNERFPLRLFIGLSSVSKDALDHAFTLERRECSIR
jgi:hypothetical protein